MTLVRLTITGAVQPVYPDPDPLVPPGWKARAACRCKPHLLQQQTRGNGYGSDAETVSVEHRDLCWNDCPVRVACLEAAFAEEQDTGAKVVATLPIRGGLTGAMRAVEMRRRGFHEKSGNRT